ncbi:MAG: GAF domain-containing protein [Halobacteriales archaeon]
MRRYSAHRDPDTLFKCAGRGSVLGGLMLAAVGTSVVVIQQTIDRPIINPSVMISQLWLGGSLIGTTVGHLYAEARIETALFEQLLDNTEELLHMSDATAIAEQMVDSADRILGLDTVAVYEPVDETTLEPLAATERTAEFFDGVPSIESRDAIAWSVLDSGDPTFADDVRDHPDVYNPDTPVRSEMIIPVSDIGVFIS